MIYNDVTQKADVDIKMYKVEVMQSTSPADS